MDRFRNIVIDEPFDMIVAIANGGLVPAGILAQRLGAGGASCGTNGSTGSSTSANGGIEVRLLRINLRDEQQRPRYDAPQLLSPIDFEFAGKRILLVDDRIKSGSTIRLARELLADAAVVRTFAVNGTADYALYDEACFRFPWVGTPTAAGTLSAV
ncbi:MAG: phosphoribosyltransferase domain-containing protein [Alistipes sp.]|jgi:xanthine phosphoribosyltransferase|nr:phosphoribosyltransferase domain-containing protein [Alistipes sp.]